MAPLLGGSSVCVAAPGGVGAALVSLESRRLACWRGSLVLGHFSCPVRLVPDPCLAADWAVGAGPPVRRHVPAEALSVVGFAPAAGYERAAFVSCHSVCVRGGDGHGGDTALPRRLAEQLHSSGAVAVVQLASAPGGRGTWNGVLRAPTAESLRLDLPAAT